MKYKGDWIRGISTIVAAVIIVVAGTVTWFIEHHHAKKMQTQINSVEHLINSDYWHDLQRLRIC